VGLPAERGEDFLRKHFSFRRPFDFKVLRHQGACFMSFHAPFSHRLFRLRGFLGLLGRFWPLLATVDPTPFRGWDCCYATSKVAEGGNREGSGRVVGVQWASNDRSMGVQASHAPGRGRFLPGYGSPNPLQPPCVSPAVRGILYHNRITITRR